MTRKNHSAWYLRVITAENAIKDAIRQPLVAAANTLADEVRSLREENAEARRLLVKYAGEKGGYPAEVEAFLSQQATS